jgi:hypothetical protein
MLRAKGKPIEARAQGRRVVALLSIDAGQVIISACLVAVAHTRTQVQRLLRVVDSRIVLVAPSIAIAQIEVRLQKPLAKA